MGGVWGDCANYYATNVVFYVSNIYFVYFSKKKFFLFKYSFFVLIAFLMFFKFSFLLSLNFFHWFLTFIYLLKKLK